MATYTSTQAARRLVNVSTGEVGITRQRLSQMISAGIVHAVRDIHGCWLVDGREIARVNRLARRVGRPKG